MATFSAHRTSAPRGSTSLPQPSERPSPPTKQTQTRRTKRTQSPATKRTQHKAAPRADSPSCLPLTKRSQVQASLTNQPNRPRTPAPNEATVQTESFVPSSLSPYVPSTSSLRPLVPTSLSLYPTSLSPSPPCLRTTPSHPTIERLRRLLARHEARRLPAGGRRAARVSTGWLALDDRLPGGGLPGGSVIEVLSEGMGCGAGTLALRTALNAVGGGDSRLVVVDCDGDFYPPAAAAMGLPVDRLVVVRAGRAADAFWATEQALRCRSVGAVVATRLVLDEVRSRRLQLAAERSGGMALVLSPFKKAAGRHSFAAVRLLIEPVAVAAREGEAREGEAPAEPGPRLSDWSLPHRDRFRRSTADDSSASSGRRLRVTILKVREGMPVEPVILDVADETFDVPLHSVSVDREAEEKRSIERRISA